jgi:hypothetical protein
MVKQPSEPRMVKATRVREWLGWFRDQAEQNPHNTEIRRLNNQLRGFTERAGATTFSTANGGLASGFDWEGGSIAFPPAPGFGYRAVERLLTRISAVTGLRG